LAYCCYKPITMTEIKVYRDRNFQIVCGASLVMIMMVSIIVPAFPRIMEAFGVDEQSIGLLGTATTLPSFLFVPVAGVMADRLGRRRLLVASLFLHGIFGGACAFAPNFTTLLILRIFQGIGVAPLLGLSGTLIGDLFTGHRRTEAMALNTTVMYLGYIVYPLLGGALASLAWNYAFLPYLLAIPLGIIALVFLRSPEPQSQTSLKDYLRDALSYIKSLKALWLFSAAGITYLLFYGGYLVYFSLLLGSRFNASPFTVGLFVTTMGVITAITSSQAGKLSKRFSVVLPIIGAFAIYALSMAIVPTIPNLWLCLLPTIFFGIAHGLNLPCQRVIATSIAPLEHRAGFNAVYGTMITLGMTIGPPIMGLVYSLTSVNTTFVIAALIALIIPAMAITIGKDKLSAI